MTIEIVMPKIGLNMQEGLIVEWVKQEGEQVRKGDVLFIVETDKVTVDSEAQQDGTLVKILVPEGERVPVKTPVAIMLLEGESFEEGDLHHTVDIAEAEVKASEVFEPHKTAQAVVSESGKVLASPKAKRFARQHGVDLLQIAADVNGVVKFEHVLDAASLQKPPTEKILATPVAKRLAKENGIDLATVNGTGTAGKITREDIEKALAEQTSESLVQTVANRVQIQGVRAVIAERMLHSSQSTAAVTLHSEIDVTQMVAYREARKSGNFNVIPSYNAILISMVAKALALHPMMNARIVGDVIEQNKAIHVGLAVDQPDGLRVVVVKNADQKSIQQIQVDLDALIERIQSNRGTLEDVSGATFTLTNLGAYDVDRFTPIINAPEVGILGIGRILEKVILKDGKIAQRSMMTLSLTFDHRAMDGAPAARFMQQLAKLIAELD